MKNIELQYNHTYLVKDNNNSISATIIPATILLITNTSYQIRWNLGNGSDVWWLKTEFNNSFSIIEDISDYLQPKTEILSIDKPMLATTTKLVQCYICHGHGTIPDTNVTGGKLICPACNGAKMIESK